jgi:hypothetical protein
MSIRNLEFHALKEGSARRASVSKEARGAKRNWN